MATTRLHLDNGRGARRVPKGLKDDPLYVQNDPFESYTASLGLIN